MGTSIYQKVDLIYCCPLLRYEIILWAIPKMLNVISVNYLSSQKEPEIFILRLS
jgi:hypothetical protein